MDFQLQDIDPEKDFKELIECEWESYEKPNQTFFRLFCPIIGEGPDAREESVIESTIRQLEWHTSDPTSYWQKAVDTKSGKIVGGALWKICQENPFEGEDHSEAYWYPAGGQRDFVTKALHQFDAPRARLAPRPQLYLNIIFTHPEYRRKGIADQIMKWGIKKADEMELETWLDATVYGIPVYEKHGFKIVNENNICPQMNEVKSKEWEKLEQELCPMTMWQMWRPANVLAGSTKEKSVE